MFRFVLSFGIAEVCLFFGSQTCTLKLHVDLSSFFSYIVARSRSIYFDFMLYFLFKLKCEDGKLMKCKSRYVFGGHRSVAGIDFIDTMSHMAALKSVRSVLALAAPAEHYLRNYDISQAFTFSVCERGVIWSSHL